VIDTALAVGAASAAAVAAGAAALAIPPTPRLAPRVRPYTTTGRELRGHDVLLGDVGAPRGLTATVVRRFGRPGLAALRRVGQLVERRTDASLSVHLRQAGVANVTPDEYRARVALQVVASGGAGALLGALVFRSALAALVLTACGVVFGSSRLRGRLERGIERRRERIRLELYTVNQLLAMHVRTGAGPVQATQRVIDRGRGDVVDELRDALTWMRHGVGEADAFRRAAALTPEPAAARTYKLFAAGAERGVDLADGLRALSEDLRDARREEIRKTATKRRAAMLVPTIAVLAPVMLVFIAAPLPSIVFGSR
jgi:tight adherence protein C